MPTREPLFHLSPEQTEVMSMAHAMAILQGKATFAEVGLGLASQGICPECLQSLMLWTQARLALECLIEPETKERLRKTYRERSWMLIQPEDLN